MIKFVSLSEFIRYRAIKVPLFNYFNTLRGAWSDFLWAEWSSAVWAELSSDIGTTWVELSWTDFFLGRVVLGRLVFGPSCPEPVPTIYLILSYICTSFVCLPMHHSVHLLIHPVSRFTHPSVSPSIPFVPPLEKYKWGKMTHGRNDSAHKGESTHP